MAGPLTLVILVAAGQESDASTEGAARATREALGVAAHVEVHETRGTPTDADAVNVESGAHVDAVAEVRWSDARHRQATLHVLVSSTGQWVYRTIGFATSDAPIERGRALGFAIASMLPERNGPAQAASSTPPPPPEASGSQATSRPPAAPFASESPSPQAPPPPPPPPPPASPPSQASSSPPTSPSLPPQPARVTADSSGPREPQPSPSSAADPTGPGAESRPPTTTRAPRVAIDVVGLGAVGVGGSAQGVGALAAAQWFVLPTTSVRLGVGALAGSVPGAQATTQYVLGELGVALHPLRARRARPLGVALRLDYVFMEQSMSRADSGGAPSASSASPTGYGRWLSGAAATAEAEWFVAPGVEGMVGAGLVDLFGPTYVDVQGARVATIPAVRALGEAGVRLPF